MSIANPDRVRIKRHWTFAKSERNDSVMIMDSMSAADRAQLHELYSRSVVLPELGRISEWADLFEPQAVFRCVQAGAGRIAERLYRGRDDILHLGELIARNQFDIALGDLAQPSRLRHVMGNLCLFEEGVRHAFGIAQLTVVAVGEREPRWVASGTYTDKLHKGGAGCWRFLSRKFTPDGVPTTSRINSLSAVHSQLAANT